MSKIVSVYSLICVQPEQIQRFTVHDTWQYLACLTNACAQLESAIVSMEYLLRVFEIVLKIAGPALYQSYGPYFLQLLGMIQDQILIHFQAEKHPKKPLLETFIKAFIQSQGREAISLFVATKN